jgi:hypothetical protein
VCAHTKKKKEKREKKRREKKEKDPRQGKKDIMRNDNSSED